MMDIYNLIKYSLPALLLMAAVELQGQTPPDIPQFLKQKFGNYIEKVPWEEVYLHTDRKEFISGEDLWFKAYLIDRKSLKVSPRSRIIYVELLNAENRPVVRKRILIAKGSGPGNIQLPDTLSTGSYTIRAYTNYMKNFLPGNCFVKEISVFNALNNSTFRPATVSRTVSALKLDPRIQKAGNGNGIEMVVTSKDSGSIINIITDQNFRTRNNGHVCLFIQTHGIIDQSRMVSLSGDTTNVYIPEKGISEGINHITVFNTECNPVCERYAWTRNIEKPGVSIQIPDSSGTRSMVTVEINSGKSSKSAEDLTDLSMSVITSDADEDSGPEEYLIFGSEFGDHRQFAGKSGKISGMSEEEMVALLKNLRSNWIDWSRVLSDSLPKLRYKAESEFHFLNGTLRDMDRNESLPDKIVLMCTPGKQPDFQYAITDRNGNFSFRVHIDEEKKDFILMPDKVQGNQKIITPSSFPEEYTPSALKAGMPVGKVPSYIEDLSTNYQVRKIYGVTSSAGTLDPLFAPPKPVRFYGKPDIELIMARYIVLPRMEEVFFELLPHVSLKMKNSAYEVTVTDRIADTRFEFSPALFIDGIKITDASLIAAIDPAIVEKIDVVQGKYQIGNYTMTGIVNIITKNADFSDVPLKDYMSRISYRVADPVPVFSAPDYSTEESLQSPVPDFRNTLSWSPVLKPGKDGRLNVMFRTSDLSGVYRISVQGFNSDGKLISMVKTFRVR
jgi:hypothetical protein